MLLRVREFRRKARLSQAALATQSQCSRELISAIEVGRHNPNTRLLGRIAGALRVPVWSLFPDEDESSPEAPTPPPGGLSVCPLMTWMVTLLPLVTLL